MNQEEKILKEVIGELNKRYDYTKLLDNELRRAVSITIKKCRQQKRKQVEALKEDIKYMNIPKGKILIFELINKTFKELGLKNE